MDKHLTKKTSTVECQINPPDRCFLKKSIYFREPHPCQTHSEKLSFSLASTD